MAEYEKRYKENVPGKYFVDDACIQCDECALAAPHNFALANETGYSYVLKQPENAFEEQQCVAAKEACPVEAIGEYVEASVVQELA